MDVTSRKDAISRGLNKYFTGEPCKSGHIAQRYTQSSVCLECLHPSGCGSPRRQLAERMQKVLLLIHPDDYETVLSTVHLCAQMREPSLTREDVQTRVAPKAQCGKMLYTFRAFPEDAKDLYHLQETLSYNRLDAQEQAFVRSLQPRRLDGWEPPPAPAVRA